MTKKISLRDHLDVRRARLFWLGELSWEEKAQVELHTKECDECNEYLETIKEILFEERKFLGGEEEGK